MASGEVIALLDLDTELLLFVIEASGATGQAVCQGVCKLLALLVEEVEKTTPFFASASIEGNVDLATTAMDYMESELVAMPTMGMLLSTSRKLCAEHQLRSLVTRLPKSLELVGAVCSEIVETKDGTVRSWEGDGATPGGATLALGRFPEAEVRSFLLTEMPSQLGAVEFNGAAEPGWKVFVLYPCGRGTRFVEQLIEKLQRAHPDAAIIGGIVTGEQIFRMSGGGVEVSAHGVAGLMFRGNVPLTALVTRGCAPLSSPYTIASAQPPEVVDRMLGRNGHAPCADWAAARQAAEAARQPVEAAQQAAAADPARSQAEEAGAAAPEEGEFYELLTELRDQAGATTRALPCLLSAMDAGGAGGALLLGLSADPESHGYELLSPSSEMVPSSAQRLQGLYLPRPAPGKHWDPAHGGVGGSVRFFALSPEQCRLDVPAKLEAVAEQARVAGQRLLGACMFTCAGRGAGFFGEPAYDAASFARIFPHAKMLGFYAGGEIGPKALAAAPASRATQVGRAAMQGFTAVFGLFMVPQRTERGAPLAHADAAAVGAAYAAARAARTPPPPPAGRLSAAQLRQLPAKELRKMMASLSLEFVSGMDKDEIIRAIAEAQES